MRFVAITQADVNNGNGCRTTLWVAGCSHHCPGCHNPWTWEYNQGKKFDEIKDRLIDYLSKPYIKGLTVSGGDPLAQNVQDLIELSTILESIKLIYPEKDIWMYTGFKYEDLDKYQLDVLKYVDVLIDGPFIEAEKDLALPFRGSRNQRIIYMKDLK